MKIICNGDLVEDRNNSIRITKDRKGVECGCTSPNYKLDEEDDVLDRDDIYSFEFMCQCFIDGMKYVRPLQEYESYSSSTNDETEKVMFRIIQIVMSWEPEAENDEVDE